MASDAPSSEITARELVHKLANQCIGFHFSNENAFGKTSHAYLLKSSPHASQIASLIAAGSRKGIYNFKSSNGPMTAEHTFLKTLYDYSQAKTSGISISTATVTSIPLKPLSILVKGSMVNSIATICAVKGVIQKTGAFYSVESDIVGALISTSMRVGYATAPGTAAHAIKHPAIHSRLTRSPTLSTFFNVSGFQHSRPMAIAIFNVWVTYSTLKEGYSDAGARFRDATSRKLAQGAYDDALHCALYTIQC